MNGCLRRRAVFGLRLEYNYLILTATRQYGTSTQQEPKGASEKKPIWYYSNKAIRNRKLNQLMTKVRSTNDSTISNNPGCDYETDESVSNARRLFSVFKSFEFDDNKIESIIFIKPRVLELSKSKLKKRMTSLLMLDFPKDVIKSMIRKCPSLLLLDQEKMSLQKRLNVLQELNIQPRLTQERCLYILQKTPQILLIDEKENLSLKVKNLKDLGLNELQVYELIMKHPAILTYSVEAVKNKVQFVVDKLGGRLALFVKFPRVFSASMQRLQERYDYLMEEGYMRENSRLTENKLRAIVLTTDENFVYRVTDTKMKDFRRFQRESRALIKQQEQDKENGKALVEAQT